MANFQKGFPLLLFLLIFAIYVPGISGSVYGGDSGDIILAAYFGGVAHPPGYPLNSIFGYLFTHLPFSASVAYKAGLMMAVFSAGTVVFLFLVLEKLLKNFYAAFAAVLVFAFSHLVWLYAHTVEVFQINLFLVSASTYFLILWRSKVIEGGLKKSERWTKFLFAAFFFLGLAVFHHQTSVLLIPAFLYLANKTYKPILGLNRNSLTLLAFFLFGAAPYVVVPFLANTQPPINWDNAVNIRNFLRLVSRSDYGTFTAAPIFTGTGYVERLLQIVSYFAFAKNDFKIIGLILITAGSLYCFFKEKTVFVFLLVSVLLVGPFFLLYSSFGLTSDFIFGIWERFALLSYFFLAIFLGFGFKAVLQNLWIFKPAVTFLRRDVLLLIITGAFFLLPLYLFMVNFQKSDLSAFKLGDWLGHDVLVSSDPGSLIFLFNDTVGFNTQYVYHTSNEFSDRKIITGGILRHSYYRRQVSNRYPDILIPNGYLDDSDLQSAEFMRLLIVANAGTFPVYSLGYTPKIEGFHWVTSGLLRKLVKDGLPGEAEFVRAVNRSAVDKFALDISEANSDYSNLIPQSIKALYASFFSDIGATMLAAQDPDEASYYYKLSNEIEQGNIRAGYGIAKASLEMGDCSDAKAYANKAYDLDKENYQLAQLLLDIARACDKDESAVQKYEMEVDRLKKKQFIDILN